MTTRKTKNLEDFNRLHNPVNVRDAETGETFHDREIDWDNTRRAIVVAAQNATPVHEGFWAVLTNMARHLKAELVVIPLRYKNPTSVWTGSQQNAEWWAPEVRPFLQNVRENMNDGIALLADMKVQPTMAQPLSGVDGVTKNRSCIVGHVRAHTRSVATPNNRMAKLVMTSGACTVPNYTDTRIGRLSQFHHSLSAILVELGDDGEAFHARRLHYTESTKRVIDLGTAYYAGKVEKAPPSLALIQGDTHVDFVDPDVVRATFGPGGIVEATRPRYLVWHDLLDGYSCNPHHRDNPFNRIAKMVGDRSSVREEIARAIAFVREKTKAARAHNRELESIVVDSNHNSFPMRWMQRHDWREDPVNAEFYLETALEMVRQTRLTGRGAEYPDPFTMWLRRAAPENVRVLDPDESFNLDGVELSLHFDRGPNGARGSLKNLRNLGTKAVGGHSHSPGEEDGVTQVGTSTRLRLEYNAGPSSWLNAHCDLNADGKRQLIMIVDGEFRL